MKLGLCSPLDRMQAAKDMGYDYLEPAVSAVAAMPAQAYEDALAARQALAMPVEAMNVFVPGHIPLTGPDVQMDKVRAYLSGAMERAAAFGTKVIVFGSGGARRVPDGFSRTRATEQIGDFLRLCDALAGPLGLRIAIEPLGRGECNILNSVGEATELARALALPAVGVLADTYHMHTQSEPLTAIVDAGPLLWHVHIANPVGRLFPRPGDGWDYGAVFDALSAIGYAERVSVEVGDPDFDGGAPLALQTLRRFAQ